MLSGVPDGEWTLMLSGLAGPWFDLGCDGGDFQGGIEYITENGGIDTEADYPYLAEDAKCE